nr:hypothetical protein [bacterium]
MVYSLVYSAYVAVYVAASVTATGDGFHQLKTYHVCSVKSFDGIDGAAGTTPYSTSVTQISVQSSFFHVIGYFLFVESYVAVYIASSVTVCIDGSHDLNVYSYSAVDQLVGFSP